MLVTFDGRMGQGKSAAACGLAIAEQKLNGQEIYSTMHLYSALYCRHCQPAILEGNVIQRKHRLYPFDPFDPTKYENTAKVTKDSWYYCDSLQVKMALEGEDEADEIRYTYLTLRDFYETLAGAANGERDIRNGIFLVDEAYLIADARMSGSKINRNVNAFAFTTRKRGIDMYLTTHDVTRLDKRIRSAIDLKISCRFSPETDMITLRIRDMHTGARRRLKLWGPETAFPYYETEEIVRPQGKIYKMKMEELT